MTNPNWPAWLEIGADVAEVIEPAQGLTRMKTPTRVRAIIPGDDGAVAVQTEDRSVYSVHPADGTVYPQMLGRYAGYRLLPMSHDLVLAIRARQHLLALADLAKNLSHLNARRPREVLAHLLRIERAAKESRQAIRTLVAEVVPKSADRP